MTLHNHLLTGFTDIHSYSVPQV